MTLLLFARERLALLAVPKTGSTAWAAALGPRADMVMRAPPPLKHMTLRRFRNRLLPLLEQAGVTDVETVAVVRQPEDWLGSWYRYRARPALNGRDTSTLGISFDDFVNAYLGTDRPAYARLGSQARFVAPAKDGRKVDHLFRYEDQERLVEFMQARLGVPVDLPRRNASRPAALDLSEATRARLRRQRSEDFALYEELAVS
ncbi:MAG: gamma-glutamyl kinase [Rhodovulum sp.]